MKKTKQKQQNFEVSIRIPEEVYQKLSEQAKKLLLKPSQYVKMIISKSLQVF